MEGRLYKTTDGRYYLEVVRKPYLYRWLGNQWHYSYHPNVWCRDKSFILIGNNYETRR